MNAAEFTAFLAECLDPGTEAGRAMLTPLRVRSDQDRVLAVQVASLVSHRRGSKPITVDNPLMLPPCF